jgi:nicotinate-nucleotide pyrophosphorylase (carboxylating)
MSVDEIIRLALAEDLGSGDHTTRATIDREAPGSAKLLIKQEGILCGINLAEKIFSCVDQHLVTEKYFQDGQPVKQGDIAFTVKGSRASILMAERVASPPPPTGL